MKGFWLALFLISPLCLHAQRYHSERTRPLAPAEARTAAYLESIRHDPLRLQMLLREMPKGGDLHNHLGGAIYAESFIEWLVEAGGCVDSATMTAMPCDRALNPIPASRIAADPVLYRSVVDAWSTRNYELRDVSGHDQFFDTFGRFGYAGAGRESEILAEAMTHAARDRLNYLELMRTLDGGRVIPLALRVGWNPNFAELRSQLIEQGLRDSLRAALADLVGVSAGARSLLGCDRMREGGAFSGACSVEVRYLYQVLRGLPKQVVFAQLLAGFELAELSDQVVGFNMVMPEDYPVPLRDFDLHMSIIDFLRPLYPKARISLHAGELVPGLVPPDELCCHIRKSIEFGHAERIGHGIDVAYEDDADGLLDLMADRDVAVEICLTSNDVILGVTGAYHPLGLYIDRGIATMLATDDEGVSRIDLTHEFVKGVLEQGLGYLDLKRMARTSLDRAFIRGEGIWEDLPSARVDARYVRSGRLTAEGENLLQRSDRARLQWDLEQRFVEFESRSR